MSSEQGGEAHRRNEENASLRREVFALKAKLTASEALLSKERTRAALLESGLELTETERDALILERDGLLDALRRRP